MLTYANCEFVTTRRPCTCADFLEISAKNSRKENKGTVSVSTRKAEKLLH